jgi:hypothetical protein
MALTAEQMADFVATELIEEFDRFGDWMLAFLDRYSKYGDQYASLVTEQRRSQVEAAYRRFLERTSHLAD